MKVRVSIETVNCDLNDDYLDPISVSCVDDKLHYALARCLRAVDPPRMYNELAKVVDYVADCDTTSELSVVKNETLLFILAARDLVDRYRALDKGNFDRV